MVELFAELGLAGSDELDFVVEVACVHLDEAFGQQERIHLVESVCGVQHAVQADSGRFILVCSAAHVLVDHQGQQLGRPVLAAFNVQEDFERVFLRGQDSLTVAEAFAGDKVSLLLEIADLADCCDKSFVRCLLSDLGKSLVAIILNELLPCLQELRDQARLVEKLEQSLDSTLVLQPAIVEQAG